MSGRRTLLLLGGSRQQVVAIEKARESGYRTVLCDYLPDNPGQFVADVSYQVSTVDRRTVLDVARKEDVSGVIAYSSDPAAPTAAYVAEQLGLPTNPLSAVETMSMKAAFRGHMRKTGLPCPGSVCIPADAAMKEAETLVGDLSFPLVVKPTDSSGSKGVTVVREPAELPAALEAARKRGRNGKLIAEEYVERSFPHVIGGDVFVVGGEVRFWGLMSCLRDARFPLVPVGKMIPSGLSPAQGRRVRGALQQLVTSLGVRFGELNVEVILGEGDIPYVVELGARAGGNMIPVQLSDASGVDLVRANVMCAMGDDPGDVGWEPGCCCFAHYVLHADREGAYEGVELSPEAEAACYRKVLYQEPGARVHRFDGADKALGILFFEFDDEPKMRDVMGNPRENMKVVLA